MKFLLRMVTWALITMPCVALSAPGTCDVMSDPFYLDSHCAPGSVHKNYRPLEVVTDKRFYDCHVRIMSEYDAYLSVEPGYRPHDERTYPHFILSRIGNILFPGSVVEHAIFESSDAERFHIIKWFPTSDDCPYVGDGGEREGVYIFSAVDWRKESIRPIINVEEIYVLSLLFGQSLSAFLYLNDGSRFRYFWGDYPSLFSQGVELYEDSLDELEWAACSGTFDLRVASEIEDWKNYLDNMNDDECVSEISSYIQWPDILKFKCSQEKILISLSTLCSVEFSDLVKLIEEDAHFLGVPENIPIKDYIEIIEKSRNSICFKYKELYE